jgi:DNA-binding MarR family transcriptional regulator
MTSSSSRSRKPTEPTARLGFLLYRSGLAIARGYERALKPIDASPTDAGVLSALAYSGPNHTRGLARMLRLGRQTIVNVTKRLEDSGLIERNASDHDGRLSMFAISKKGSTRLTEIEVIASGFDGQLRVIVGAVNEQRLVDSLQRVLAAPFLTHEE